MKKSIRFLLALLVLVSALALQSFAAEPEFRFELTVDGKDTVEVNQGDVITVTLYLHRTDAEAPYTMYAMQDEIRYNSDFFQLVPDSALLSSGIQSTDISVLGNFREFYMNFLSFSGGAQWQPKTRIGSFQLKVTADSGVATITNEDFLVSLKDGSGSYKCEANTLTVILTSTCTVKYETNGGSAIDPVTAVFGETLKQPADPIREGKQLVGWFKDIHLREAWDFAKDTVSGNMTLYAKWEDIPVEPTPGEPTDPKPVEPSEPSEPTEPTEPTGPKEDGISLVTVLLIGMGLVIIFLLILLLFKRKKEDEEEEQNKKK